MPYPNEHSARVVEPDKFQQETFRRVNIADGIDTIQGRLYGEDSMTIQTYRFDSSKFTPLEAKQWLKDHNIDYISFEEATNSQNNSNKEIFVARYIENGVKKSVAFNKMLFDEEKATRWLNARNIQNFFLAFEPYQPEPFGENDMLFRGDVGFDITLSSIMPYVESGKGIILDTFGGDLFEGWKIHDAIKLSGKNPSIGVIGSCASSGMQILLATENRWVSENSRTLVHNPWAFEAGDDEQMLATGEMLKKDKLQLAKLYSTISGKPIDEMLDLMKQEIFLNAEETKNLNFAKYVKLNSQQKNDEMDGKQLDEKLSLLGSLVQKIENLFKPKNLMIQDVNGNEIDFGDQIQSVDEIAVGLTATVGGSPADGDYTLDDGSVLTFNAGTLETITPPAPSQEQQLQAEIDRLTAELQEANKAKTAVENQLNAERSKFQAKIAEFETLKSEFEGFKNQFSKDNTQFNNMGRGDDDAPRVRKAYK